MGSRYIVEANGRQYTVVDDCTISYRALIVGSVSDEIFGDLFATDFEVSIDRGLLATKTTSSGLFAISGYPEQAFPLISSTPCPVTLKVEAPGFRTATVPMTVPQNAVFPVSAPAAALRRLPIRIQGRVVKDALPRTPLAGVLIHSQNVTVLRSPLYFAHTAGKPVQEALLTSVGSAALDADASAGTQVLELHSRTGLAPGVLVRLSNASQSLLEYGVVDHIGPGVPAAAGQVFLTGGLNRSYPKGTTAGYFTAAPGGLTSTLTAQADAGDGVLLANPVLSVTTVSIEAGTPVAEYHEIGALSDTDGFYGLDGMGRVRDILLQANTSAVVDWYLDYGQAVNIVDFRL